MRLANRLSLSALAATAALAAACSPNLSNLTCNSSTECPSGNTCDLAAHKCVPGDTKPEITVVTDLTATFTGRLIVQLLVADQKGIDSVGVKLGTHPEVAAANTSGDHWKADIDTKGQGITDETLTVTITAKNKAGATNTATAANVHIDNAGPAINSITVSPASVYPGQAATIVFQTGEAITTQPVVAVTPPGVGASSRYAQFVSVSGSAPSTYTYSFAAVKTDPAGAWTVSVTAEDALHNVTVATGSNSLTVQADPAGGGLALTATGGAQGIGTELKNGSSATLTATFAKPLLAGQVASAVLCPVASGNPTCLSSAVGALPLTPTGAAGGTTYSFAVAPPPIAPQEGAHVVTVKGTNVSGETISADIVFNFDFTAPHLNGVDFVAADVVNRDGSGFALFTTQIIAPATAPRNVHAAVQLTEAPAPGTLLVKLDETTPGTGTTLATSVEQPNPFSAPEFYVLLDGSTLLDGTHTLTAHVRDLAGNDASPVSTSFVVKSTDPVNANTSFLLNTATAPANVRGGVNILVQAVFDRPVAAWQSMGLLMSRVGPAGSFPLIPYNAVTQACPAGTCNAYQFVGTAPAGTSNDGAYQIVLASSGPTDSFGNPIAGASSSGTIQVDNTPPAVTWVSNPAYVSGATTFIFDVGETVTLASAVACVDPAATAADPCAGASSFPTISGNANTTQAQFSVTPPASTQANHLLMAKYTDAAGNVGFKSMLVRYDNVRPTLSSFSWNRTVAGPSSTAVLTISASEPIGSPVLSAGALSGVGIGTPLAVGTSGNSYQVTVTMPATCNGGVNPTDGTPFATTVSFSDSAGNLITGSGSTGSLTCVATPVVLAASWNRTVAGPGQAMQLTVTLNEPANLTSGWFSGTSPVYNVSGAYSSFLSSTGGFTYLVNYTFPGSCNGANVAGRLNPTDSVPFQPFLSVTPTNGGTVQQAALPGTLTCVVSATVLSATYSPASAVAAPGQTVTLNVVTSAPMSSITASGTGITVGTASAVGGTGTQWNIPLTIPAPSATACAPMPDGTAVAVSVSGTTVGGSGMSAPAGQVTCSESRVDNITNPPLPALFSLLQQPQDDGTVRTFVQAAPGAVHGVPALNGIQLQVRNPVGGSLLGSAPVNPIDGSVPLFTLSQNVLRPNFSLVDLVGNTTSVSGYPEEIELNFAGKDRSAANTTRAFNVSGSSGFFDPAIWLDGGIALDGGLGTGPVGGGPAGPLPDGGIVELSTNCDAGASYCALVQPDSLQAQILGGVDAGTQFAFDFLTTSVVSDAGMPSRYSVGTTAIGNTIYMFGGCDPNLNPACPWNPADAGPDVTGAVWARRIDQEQSCPSDGGACTVGTGWTLIPPATSTVPVARYNTNLTNDGQSVYLFNGSDQNGNGTNSIFKWDPATATWTDTTEGSSFPPPIGRGYYQLANGGSTQIPYFIPGFAANTPPGPYSGISRQSFALFGGNCRSFLYDFSKTTPTDVRPWTQSCGNYYDAGNPWNTIVAGQPVYGQTLVFDPTVANGRLWAFGGQEFNNAPAVNTYVCCSNKIFQGTWSVANSNWSWSLVTPNSGTVPPARFYAQGFWDAKANKVIITGGQFGSTSYSDVWEFDPATKLWRDASDQAPESFKLNSSNPVGNYESLVPVTYGQGSGMFLRTYYLNTPPYGYVENEVLLRREEQQRLLVRAPFTMPYFYGLTSPSIEVESVALDPNAQVFIWSGYGWDYLGSPTKFIGSYAFDMLPYYQGSGIQLLLGPVVPSSPTSQGVVTLLIKRGPGNQAGAAQKPLVIDDLRIHFRFQ